MSRMFLVCFIHIYKQRRHSWLCSALYVLHTAYIINGIYFTIIFMSVQTFVWDLILWLVLRATQPTTYTHTHASNISVQQPSHIRIDREYVGATMQLEYVFALFTCSVTLDLLLKISPFRFILYNRMKFRKKNAMRPDFLPFLGQQLRHCSKRRN